MTLRTPGQRIADTKRRLATDADVWVATASPDGIPHLIPLSLAWIDEVVVCVTYADSPTARNVEATGVARCSLDSTNDVVVMRTTAQTRPFAGIADEQVREMVRQWGWDPGDNPEYTWSVLEMTPTLVHAWNSEPEITGRTIMRAGAWAE